MLEWIHQKKKVIEKDVTAFLGLFAFIATGGGLILSTLIREKNFYKTEILLIFGCFFGISLVDHYRKLMESTDEHDEKNENDIYVFLCALVGVCATWFINHEMGYGPIIANGLVGVMAATFLPNDLAGITYTSSFIGMSSISVIPSLTAAALASIVVAIILLTTAKIYAGIGGKGGTTAALSTLITKALIRMLS